MKREFSIFKTLHIFAIAGLLAIMVTLATRTPLIGQVSAQPGNQFTPGFITPIYTNLINGTATYSYCQSFAIFNNGGAAVYVQGNSLAVNNGVSWGIQNKGDLLNPITVVATNGASCIITFTQ